MAASGFEAGTLLPSRESQSFRRVVTEVIRAEGERTSMRRELARRDRPTASNREGRAGERSLTSTQTPGTTHAPPEDEKTWSGPTRRNPQNEPTGPDPPPMRKSPPTRQSYGALSMGAGQQRSMANEESTHRRHTTEYFRVLTGERRGGGGLGQS